MTFGLPGWIIAGGLASLAILYLHFIRPRRRPVRVSSLYLWRKLEREISLNRRRKRILTSLLLLLQLLVVALLSFALARPDSGGVSHGREVAVVVDTSASMGLFEPGGTRFSLAKARVERYLSEGDADRYSLWSAGDGALHYAGPSKSELLAAMNRLPDPAGLSDWDTTFTRVASLHGDAGHLHTVIATDGAFSADRWSKLATVGAEVAVITVGTPYGNVGITGFSARDVGEDPFLHQVLISVSNLSGNAQTATVVVESDRPALEGRDDRQTFTLREDTLTLSANATQRIIFEHRFRPGEILTARLDVSDLFTADNEATLVATSRDAFRILVVGGAGYLLRQGFEAFPQVQISEALSLPPPDIAAHFDLMIFYDRPIPDDFSGDAIAFISGRNVQPDAPHAEISWWNRAHPLSRFVAWDEINLGPAPPLSLSPGESVLVETTQGPIVTVREELGRRIVRATIPLERSDFPFRIAYPVFLHNLIEWFHPHAASLVPDPSPPGRLPPQAARALEQGGGPLLLYALYEPARRIEVDRVDTVELSRFLARPGAYGWEANGRSGIFAVSLVDAAESDLTPRLGALAAHGGVRVVTVENERLADVAGTSQASAESAQIASDSMGAWAARAAAVVLLVLAAESYVFSRTHGPAKRDFAPPLLSGAAAAGPRSSRPKGGTKRDASAN